MKNTQVITAHDLHLRLLNRLAPQFMLTYHYYYINGYSIDMIAIITSLSEDEMNEEIHHIETIIGTFKELMQKN